MATNETVQVENAVLKVYYLQFVSITFLNENFQLVQFHLRSYRYDESTIPRVTVPSPRGVMGGDGYFQCFHDGELTHPLQSLRGFQSRRGADAPFHGGSASLRQTCFGVIHLPQYLSSRKHAAAVQQAQGTLLPGR